jgi:cobalamin biosynthesis protein CbiD
LQSAEKKKRKRKRKTTTTTIATAAAAAAIRTTATEQRISKATILTLTRELTEELRALDRRSSPQRRHSFFIFLRQGFSV